MSVERIVVLDNGGGTIKIGFAGESEPQRVFPNCTAKPKGGRQLYVGDQLLDSRDVSQLSLRRPIDRGFLVNYDLQRDIWARAFKSVLGIDPSRCALLLTEPMLNFPQVRAAMEQLAFEEFGFQALYMAPAPYFALRDHASRSLQSPSSQALAGVVVDAGFSATTVVPYWEGRALEGSTVRINLGGKALGNFLKELVSYRSLNMMDEPYLMEQVKEQACFVSQDVRGDLAAAARGRRSPHLREYVLPDGVHNLRGYIREPVVPGRPGQQQQGAAAGANPQQGASKQQQQQQQRQGPPPLGAPTGLEQVLQLNNERFMVPEALFSPSDIGLEQAGLPEAIVQAVSSAHPAVQPLLYTNVLLTGGTARCPGFLERVVSELRPLVPAGYDVRVALAEQPEVAAWRGAALFGSGQQYWSVATSRKAYMAGLAQQQAAANRRTSDFY